MQFFARNELTRFLRYQYNEFMRIGYPGMAAFAKNIAAGTLAPAVLTADDPIMHTVASWYHGQRQVDRIALARHFLPNGGSERQQARGLGISRKRLQERIESLVRRCANALRDAGLAAPAEPAREMAVA